MPTWYCDGQLDCKDGRNLIQVFEYSKCEQNVPKIGIVPFHKSSIFDSQISSLSFILGYILKGAVSLCQA